MEDHALSTNRAGLQLARFTPTVLDTHHDDKAAKVVGIYGLPGSGKTTLLEYLESEMGDEGFTFIEGSKMIADLVPGGLATFQTLDEAMKHNWRQLAIHQIGRQCREDGKVGVVAGHFISWPEMGSKQEVWTETDLDVFTHILYLDVPPEIITHYRDKDTERQHPTVTVNHLCKWQDLEMSTMRKLCHDHGILFSTIKSTSNSLQEKAIVLLRDFQHHSEKENLSRAMTKLKDNLVQSPHKLETILVMDADETMASQDTGTMFWDMLSRIGESPDEVCPLQTLFDSPMEYSYTAMRQATLLYEEATDDHRFDMVCQSIASSVAMYPEFVSRFRMVAKENHVHAAVATSGIRRIWERVLERNYLSDVVTVIGGGRISDGLVVTAEVKAALVAYLRHDRGMHVWSFGDSPLDLPMLQLANNAIVVVGDERTRSKSMNAVLLTAIDDHGLQARQTLLPTRASPRLSISKLPVVSLDDASLLDEIFRRHVNQVSNRILHATDRNAAKLLITPLRDAKSAGPSSPSPGMVSCLRATN